MANYERDLLGNQIIGVRTIGDPDGRIYVYAWAGAVDLSVGDQLVLNINAHEWEVEVVELGGNYGGKMKVIGGEYGLSYSL